MAFSQVFIHYASLISTVNHCAFPSEDIVYFLASWLILWLHDEAGGLEGDDGLRGLVLGVKDDLDRVPRHEEQIGPWGVFQMLKAIFDTLKSSYDWEVQSVRLSWIDVFCGYWSCLYSTL